MIVLQWVTSSVHFVTYAQCIPLCLCRWLLVWDAEAVLQRTGDTHTCFCVCPMALTPGLYPGLSMMVVWSERPKVVEVGGLVCALTGCVHKIMSSHVVAKSTCQCSLSYKTFKFVWLKWWGIHLAVMPCHISLSASLLSLTLEVWKDVNSDEYNRHKFPQKIEGLALTDNKLSIVSVHNTRLSWDVVGQYSHNMHVQLTNLQLLCVVIMSLRIKIIIIIKEV